MAGHINYEEEIKKANEKLAELRKQKEERFQESSRMTSPTVSEFIDVTRRQTEQLRNMIESSNQTNVNLEARKGMASRLKSSSRY